MSDCDCRQHDLAYLMCPTHWAELRARLDERPQVAICGPPGLAADPNANRVIPARNGTIQGEIA